MDGVEQAGSELGPVDVNTVREDLAVDLEPDAGAPLERQGDPGLGGRDCPLVEPLLPWDAIRDACDLEVGGEGVDQRESMPEGGEMNMGRVVVGRRGVAQSCEEVSDTTGSATAGRFTEG